MNKRPGTKFVCSLPKAEKPWKIAYLDNGDVLALNPDHLPLIIDPKTGTYTEFKELWLKEPVRD